MGTKEIINALENLLKRVNELERSVSEKDHASIQIQIDIKEFNLKELNLDELAFHLDKLDIQELSGMLNLGNTISPKVLTRNKKKPLNKKNQAVSNIVKNHEKDIQIHISGKTIPYSFIKGKDDSVD